MFSKLLGLSRTWCNLSRRNSATRKPIASRSARPALERLEHRLIPSVDIYWNPTPGMPHQYEIRLSGTDNTVLIDHNSGGYIQVTGLNGTTVINHAQSLGNDSPAQVYPANTPVLFSDAAYSEIWVTGGTGGNSVFVNRNVKPLIFQPQDQQSPYPGSPTDHLYLGYGTLQDIQAPITVKDRYGTVSVDVYDQSDPTNRLVGLDSYGGYGAITGLAQQAIIYYSTSVTNLTLHLGTGQSNYIDVPYTFVNTTIQSNGSTTVHLGNVGGGNTEGIQGALTITNTVAGGTCLQVDDSADPVSRFITGSAACYIDALRVKHCGYILSGLSDMAPATISFDASSVSQLLLDTGTGAETVDLLGTAVPTTVVGHSVNTSVYVGDQGSVAGIAANLAVQGTIGLLKVDDSADTVFRQVNVGQQLVVGGYYGDLNPVFGAITWQGMPASISYGVGSIGTLEIDTGIGGAVVFDADYNTHTRLVGPADARSYLLEELPWVTTMPAWVPAGSSYTNFFGNLSFTGF
jgi:hypothetical protein